MKKYNGDSYRRENNVKFSDPQGAVSLRGPPWKGSKSDVGRYAASETLLRSTVLGAHA